MKTHLSLAIFLALAALAAPARAESSASPVGRWRTIDDSTHEAKSIVSLWQNRDGVLFGTIETVFPKPGKPLHPKCDKCEGALKDQPIEGMTFLWGMRWDDGEWSGGRVVDPDNGKVYRCTIKVIDGGRKIKIRGFVGVSLFGRTQYWLKEAELPPTN